MVSERGSEELERTCSHIAHRRAEGDHLIDSSGGRIDGGKWQDDFIPRWLAKGTPRRTSHRDTRRARASVWAVKPTIAASVAPNLIVACEDTGDDAFSKRKKVEALLLFANVGIKAMPCRFA
jgi:hypothetical protein